MIKPWIIHTYPKPPLTNNPNLLLNLNHTLKHTLSCTHHPHPQCITLTVKSLYPTFTVLASIFNCFYSISLIWQIFFSPRKVNSIEEFLILILLLPLKVRLEFS